MPTSDATTLAGRPGALVVPDAQRPASSPLPAPRRDGPDIALVLPLNATDYSRAAEAVRDGFLDAADAAKLRASVVVVAHGEDDVLAAFGKAIGQGAKVIVGPLVRDNLKTIATANLALPVTLALNQLDDGTPLPPSVYTLALAIESDARVVAIARATTARATWRSCRAARR